MVVPTPRMEKTQAEKNWKLFRDQMQRYRVLTAAEERVLLERAATGNTRAAQTLVIHNIRFIIGFAARYHHSGMPIMDLINEGASGAMMAALRFDLKLKIRYLSYANYWIRARMTRAIEDKARVVRIPANREAGIRKSYKIPRRQTIGGEYLAPGEQMIENLVSLSQPNAQGDILQDSIAVDDPAPDAFMKGRDNRRQILELVRRLDPKQKRVITLLYGLESGDPMTLRQVGDILGVSHERVRQIKDKALYKMRRAGR